MDITQPEGRCEVPVPAVTCSSEEPAAARHFALFAAALAVALVLDQLWWGGFEVATRHGVVVLAAFLVLARPSSVGRFAVLLAAVVVSVAADLPVVGTHRLFGLVVAATVLAHLMITAVRAGHRRAPGVVLTDIAPFVRMSLIVLYAASALAKLNTTFLDPATSCAVPSARGLLGAGALDDPRLAWVAVGGTVAVEASLPVLLAWRRTRLLGTVLGLGFHAVLALAGNVPFSALVGALYVAFLPTGTVARLLSPALPTGRGRQVAGGRSAGRIVGLGDVVLVVVLVVLWCVGAAFGPSDPAPGLTAAPSAFVSPALGETLRVVTAALLVGGATIVMLSRWRDPGSRRCRAHALRVRHTVLVAGVLVLLVDAACPYLGLKTDTSFEMFSGLRTEPGAWNHLVVPESVRVAGFQDGAVQVLAATDPALVARTGGGARILPFELERSLRAEPGSTAVVQAAGEPTAHVVGPLPAGRSTGQWLATFRDLPPPGVPRC